MRAMVSIVFLLVGFPAFAGETFVFTAVKQDGLSEEVTEGKVVVEGDKYRVELSTAPGQPPSLVILSQDAGEHETNLDLEHRTFYDFNVFYKKVGGGRQSTSRLFSLLPFGEASVRNVELKAVEKQELETISGLPTRRHGIELSYDVEVKLLSEAVKGKVRLTAVYWVAEGRTQVLPRMLRPEIRTGFAEIDSRLAEAFKKLQGLPVRQQVSIATEVAFQGTPQSEASTTTIRDLHPIATTPSLFEVPKGFRYEEPVVSGPGLRGASGR